MRAKTALFLARAESRRSRGTLLFCVLSITIGVMALVAVRSVTDSLRQSIHGQARQILGADLSLTSNLPLDTPVATELTEALAERDARAADITLFYSMLARAKGGNDKSTQLVRVRAVSDEYPFYGQIHTSPPDQFGRLREADGFIIDPQVARDLKVGPGDTLRLGKLSGPILGTFVKKPGSPASEFSLAPSVYIHERLLERTELIQTGSRIQYKRLFSVPTSFDVADWKKTNWDRALEANIRIATSRESAANVQRFLGRLAAFLTIVGLITLLLGALGIGSAMRAFMRSRVDHAAVLRAVGARPKDLFVVYSLLACGIAAVGCLIGAALGAATPIVLGNAISRLGAQFLPADLSLSPTWGAVGHGVLSGMLATFAFTLIPIWRTSTVSPLRVLRQDDSSLTLSSRWLPLVGLAIGLGAVLFLSSTGTESLRVGVAFTVAIAAALVCLSLCAQLLAFLARRVGPLVPSYRIRQGLANLHRPGNQTVSVIVASGLGVLLLSTILIIQASLENTIAIEEQSELPNLFVIDVQEDQKDAVLATFGGVEATRVEMAPMISARIRSVNGAAIDKSKVARDATQRTWEDRMRTREYFISYRADVLPSEDVVEGSFWTGTPETQEASIAENLATNLGIKIGDILTLDVQGLPVDTMVTSFRRIRWQAMRPNAMIVLSPGDIEAAPKMFVSSLRVANDEERYRLQKDLAAAFPNLSVVDISEAAKTVQLLLTRIAAVFRLLGLLALIVGGIIVAGAIASGRFARERESMLLKVLGASRGALRGILWSEYASLALFGTLAGWGLAEALNRVALPSLFQAPPIVPYLSVSIVCVGAVALNVAIGAFVGRHVSRRPPLEVLREE